MKSRPISVTDISLTAQGLGFPFGHCAMVPLSGYLLNGGIGWNSGTWGPACLSIKALDLVDAEGETVHADSQQNADYYWAARGAGPGFFGVVTRYHLQVYALPKVIRTSTLTYRLEDAARVADRLPGMIRSLPPQVETDCFIVSAPPDAKETAAASRKLLIIAATAYADTEEEARRWLEPVADAPSAPDRKQELNQPATFSSLYELTDRVFPENRRYVVDMFSSNAAPEIRPGRSLLRLPRTDLTGNSRTRVIIRRFCRICKGGFLFLTHSTDYGFWLSRVARPSAA